MDDARAPPALAADVDAGGGPRIRERSGWSDGAAGSWRRSRQLLIAGPAVGLLLVAAALAPLLAPPIPTR